LEKFTKISKISFFKIQIGNQFSLGLTENGKLYGWGRKFFLGFCEEGNQYEPRLIEKFEKNKIIQIAAGNEHILVLAEKKTNLNLPEENQLAELSLDDTLILTG
jgi:alpha-tubulin suppressor-like RCC1 family protein